MKDTVLVLDLIKGELYCRSCPRCQHEVGLQLIDDSKNAYYNKDGFSITAEYECPECHARFDFKRQYSPIYEELECRT